MVTDQTGLTRVVVLAPKRRLDVAFPDQVPLVSLLPGVLHTAGENLADAGIGHEGWVLRRTDGSALDAATSLAAQRIRDGETLHLLPRRVDWPEATYDDIIDAIADAARRRGRRWTGAASRVTGLAAGLVALGVGLAQMLRSGPPWTVPAGLALAVTVALLIGGTVVSRALPDAAAGAVLAAAAMPFAFAAGALLPLPAAAALDEFGAAQLLAGCGLLAVVGLAGHLGAADYGRVFVAGIATGLVGAAGAAVALAFSGGAPAAALVTGLLLLVSPALPALAVRIGQIPLPELPRTPEDLVRDEPRPDRRSVDAATVRADEALTGLLLGTATVTIAGVTILVHSGQSLASALAAVVGLAHLLRARFYVGVRHRAPLLVAGGAGLALLGTAPAPGRVAVGLALALVAGAAAVAAGLAYRDRAPSPRLGRLADVLDVVLTLAVVPLVAGVLGVFTFMRSLGG